MPGLQPVLILCFPRSGGTLLSRILSGHPKVLFASEINCSVGACTNHQVAPSHKALMIQMKEWYGVEIRSSDFKSAVEQILAHCSRSNRRFIIRDWTYIDYLPSSFNDHSPAYSPLTLLKLRQMNNEFKVFAFVRNAVDIFLSMRVDISVFSESYLKYVNDLVSFGIPVIKYEDLVDNPKDTIGQLDNKLEMDFSLYLDRWAENWSVTGDTQAGMASRGIRLNRIQLLKRKWVPRKVRNTINLSSSLKTANAILGYQTRYDNGNLQTLHEAVGEKLRNRFYRLF